MPTQSNIDRKSHLIMRFKQFISETVRHKFMYSIECDIRQKIISKSSALENKLKELSNEISRDRSLTQLIYKQQQQNIDQKGEEIEIAKIQNNNSKANIISSSLIINENKVMMMNTDKYYEKAQELLHYLSHYEEEKEELKDFIKKNFKFPRKIRTESDDNSNSDNSYFKELKDEIKVNLINKMEEIRNNQRTKQAKCADLYLNNSSKYLSIISHFNDKLKNYLNQNE